MGQRGGAQGLTQDRHKMSSEGTWDAYKKNSARGVKGGTGPPNLNLGPPKISETTRARILKLKTQLDIVNYSLWVKKNSPLGASRGRKAP